MSQARRLLSPIKRAIRRVILPNSGADGAAWSFPRGTPPAELTPTQELFCEWNAERMGFSLEESRRRYRESWAALLGGHVDQIYRDYCIVSYQLHQPFFDDSKPEGAFEAYGYFGYLHFLRYLSYAERPWAADHPMLTALRQVEEPTILDFGCGLAQTSRGLAEALARQGRRPRLILADMPSLRKSFLAWLGDRSGIPTTLLDCTPETPRPDIPAVHACIATEVLEHVHDPLTYFDWIDAALRPGGLFLTNVIDHHPEFFHVSPSLRPVRDRLAARGYETLQENVLYRKPG